MRSERSEGLIRSSRGQTARDYQSSILPTDSAEDPYPQILNAADVLTLLLQRHTDPAEQQSARTIRTYFTAQYDQDRDVKFKQAELQQTLTGVFVDLPLAEKCDSDELTRRQRVARPGVPPEINAYLDHLDSRRTSARPHPTSHSRLAASFFLQMPPTPGVCRFVLEGAPSQGKSTVTQFLCQSHRLRLLACRSRTVASCSDWRDALPPPKTSSNPSMACRFQVLTWFGWTSCRAAISCTVRSPRNASSATRFLKSAVNRRRRLVAHSSASRRLWNTP